MCPRSRKYQNREGGTAMTSPFKSLFAKQIKDMLQFKLALGFAEKTYYSYLLNFDRFCIQNYPNESTLTKEMIMLWGRKGAKESAKSLKRRIIAIREFSKYLSSIGIDTYVAPLEMFGRSKPFVPYIYTDAELTAFFQASDKIPSHKLSPYRQLDIPVLFRLLYCCGLRPNEVRNLRRCEINLETGVIYITESKRHKDRNIIIASDMLALCRKYDIVMKRVYLDREYFFQNPNGDSYPAVWVQRQFWKCWEITGITSFHAATPRVSDFRHNYATRVLQKWMDDEKDLYTFLPYLSAYMGHSGYSETAYYIHLLPERLIKTQSIDWEKFNAFIPEVE